MCSLVRMSVFGCESMLRCESVFGCEVSTKLETFVVKT